MKAVAVLLRKVNLNYAGLDENRVGLYLNYSV